MKHLKRVTVLSLMTILFSGLLSGIQAMVEEEALALDILPLEITVSQDLVTEVIEERVSASNAMALGAITLVQALEEGYTEIKIAADTDFDGGLLHLYARMLYPEYYALNWTVNNGIAHIRAIFSCPEEARETELMAQALVDKYITEEMTIIQRLRILHDLLVEGCQYDYEVAANPQQAGVSPFTAYGALLEGRAVCDGYTAAYALLCAYAEIPCIAVFSPDMNHSWNAVLYEGEILYIDATFNDTVDIWDKGMPPYFLLTGETLKFTHFWNEEEVKEVLFLAGQKIN